MRPERVVSFSRAMLPAFALAALVPPTVVDARLHVSAAPITVVVLPFRLALPAAAPSAGTPAAPRPRTLPPMGPGVFVPPIGGVLHAAPPNAGAGATSDTVVPVLPAGSEQDPDPAGVAVADLLVNRLLATGRFRVLDAAQLEALRRSDCAGRRPGKECRSSRRRAPRPGELYLITGSLTRMGRDDRSVGLLGGAHGILAALGFRRPRTQVGLSARLVDAASGEVVASVSSLGTSRRGGSAAIGGLGRGTGAGVAVGGGARTAATGEAIERAVDALARALVATGPAAGSGAPPDGAGR